jgi:hypothetical protein
VQRGDYVLVRGLGIWKEEYKNLAGLVMDDGDDMCVKG